MTSVFGPDIRLTIQTQLMSIITFSVYKAVTASMV
jgi:hypothetical protein